MWRWLASDRSRRLLGPKLFDTVIEIIRTHGPGGDEAEDGGVEMLRADGEECRLVADAEDRDQDRDRHEVLELDRRRAERTNERDLDRRIEEDVEDRAPPLCSH